MLSIPRTLRRAFIANEAGKFFLSELNPGTEIAGKVVFDVTQVISDPAIQLQVQTGVGVLKKRKSIYSK